MECELKHEKLYCKNLWIHNSDFSWHDTRCRSTCGAVIFKLSSSKDLFFIISTSNCNLVVISLTLLPNKVSCIKVSLPLL